MRYVKHRYSKRVYQVMEDHGEGHPYLSQSPNVRYISAMRLEKFFIPCSEGPTDSPISVLQELEWEKHQMRRDEPLVVKAPLVTLKRKRGKAPGVEKGYTLKDLCQELGIAPATARKLLRSKGKSAPDGGWRWSDSEAAKSIKKFLQKLL